MQDCAMCADMVKYFLMFTVVRQEMRALGIQKNGFGKSDVRNREKEWEYVKGMKTKLLTAKIPYRLNKYIDHDR